MRHVVINAYVSGWHPTDVFDRISDFARYPDFTDAVRKVTVEPASATSPVTVLSRWEVTFRNGIMHWSERDTVDRDNLLIEFEQTAGDFHILAGSWTVAAADGGSSVRFAAEFDLGIPTIAEIIDPIAESTLRKNIAKIVQGLLPGAVIQAADRRILEPPAGRPAGGA